jgi:tetratricopeptide (TPR) repeat protein
VARAPGPEAAATDPGCCGWPRCSHCSERSGRLLEAIAAYEQLRTAAERSPGTVPWLAPAIALVRCYRDAGDLSRAIDVGEQAVATLTAGLRADDGLHATLVSTLAGAYSERGDHARARLLLDDLITRTAAGGSTDDLARAAWNAAITATESGDPAEGWRLVHQADALLRLGDDLRGQARIQVTVAWVMLAAPDPDAEGARGAAAALPGLSAPPEASCTPRRRPSWAGASCCWAAPRSPSGTPGPRCPASAPTSRSRPPGPAPCWGPPSWRSGRTPRA